jgi:hypothetical protein
MLITLMYSTKDRKTNQHATKVDLDLSLTLDANKSFHWLYLTLAQKM